MSQIIKNRYEFSIFFDVENGNPNGDPDAANMPRVDPETGYGLVTDVCIKRKIRNYVETVKSDWNKGGGEYSSEAFEKGERGYDIYIKDGVALNTSEKRAWIAVLGTDKLEKKDSKVDLKLRNWMCGNFFDVRTFGAVMTTFVKAKLNCGQVRGPVQLGFARSIDPIVRQEVSITRVAITTEKDLETKETEMGRKHIVPYALYRADGFVSANLAQRVTGFTEDDLELFWQAILNMFEDDHSAARGKMAVRKLVIFKHENIMGNAPSHRTLELVNANRLEGVSVPRSIGDYEITVDTASCPEGVEIICRE